MLKHSHRTPMCANVFERIFRDAGGSEGLVSALHVGHGGIVDLIEQPQTSFVAFTGSVKGYA